MSFTPGKWATNAQTRLNGYQHPSSEWRAADAQTIRGAIKGLSAYTGNVRSTHAAKVVFNISSAHIPAFAGGLGTYQNRYENQKRIGQAPPQNAPDARERIDQMLASLFGDPARWDKLYYGAVELNGSGIRYYGDICLVLSEPDATTKVLNRNSFDLICQPLRSRTHTAHGNWDPALAIIEADLIAGEWSELGEMAICKVLKGERNEDRRLTVGAISEGVLSDEDYLEVIREETFGVSDLIEVRVAGADAAVDGLVADRLRRGPLPSWNELLWRHRRRKADQALKSRSVPIRVVVSSGRVRS